MYPDVEKYQRKIVCIKQNISKLSAQKANKLSCMKSSTRVSISSGHEEELPSDHAASEFTSRLSVFTTILRSPSPLQVNTDSKPPPSPAECAVSISPSPTPSPDTIIPTSQFASPLQGQYFHQLRKPPPLLLHLSPSPPPGAVYSQHISDDDQPQLENYFISSLTSSESNSNQSSEVQSQATHDPLSITSTLNNIISISSNLGELSKSEPFAVLKRRKLSAAAGSSVSSACHVMYSHTDEDQYDNAEIGSPSNSLTSIITSGQPHEARKNDSLNHLRSR